MSREHLLAIVEHDEKRRFTISTSGKLIRAAQGHSVDVDLGLGSQKEERYTNDPARGGCDRARPDRRAEPASRHEDHHHRLKRTERRSDPAGKPVRGHEQEHPEQREVEAVEKEDPAEPGAGRNATREGE